MTSRWHLIGKAPNLKPESLALWAAQIRRMCGVAKKTVLCINRLELNTRKDAMLKFLKDAGVTVYSCYKIEPKSDDPRFIGKVKIKVNVNLYSASS